MQALQCHILKTKLYHSLIILLLIFYDKCQGILGIWNSISTPMVNRKKLGNIYVCFASQSRQLLPLWEGTHTSLCSVHSDICTQEYKHPMIDWIYEFKIHTWKRSFGITLYELMSKVGVSSLACVVFSHRKIHVCKLCTDLHGHFFNSMNHERDNSQTVTFAPILLQS